MLINLRNALMTGKRLPYDSEVEFLESTGTQWIATTTIDDPANNIAQVTFSIPTSTSASMFLFGSSGVRFNFCAARWGSNRYNFGPTGATTPALPISLGEVHTGTYTLDNGQLTYTLDGDSATYASSLVYNNLPFGLFTIYNSSVNKFIGRIYNFKVIRKSDGAVLADFIPVRKGTVGYLYDRVSGKLFGNAGTGDFVVGPDVVPATWVDGEYWNTFGVATALSGASRCDNFISVQPSSSVTFYLGARPGGTVLYMVQYNSNKERVNSTYNSNNVARTVTIPANCYYIRVSAETAKKNEAYIHDNTNDRDLLRNGMVVPDTI